VNPRFTQSLSGMTTPPSLSLARALPVVVGGAESLPLGAVVVFFGAITPEVLVDAEAGAVVDVADDVAGSVGPLPLAQPAAVGTRTVRTGISDFLGIRPPHKRGQS